MSVFRLLFCFATVDALIPKSLDLMLRRVHISYRSFHMISLSIRYCLQFALLSSKFLILLGQLRVDVPPGVGSAPDVRPYVPGTPHNPPSTVKLTYPITLVPRFKNVYFVERESFNILGMLRNPMVLMMVVTGALVVGMPYLLVSNQIVSAEINLIYRRNHVCFLSMRVLELQRLCGMK